MTPSCTATKSIEVTDYSDVRRHKTVTLNLDFVKESGFVGTVYNW